MVLSNPTFEVESWHQGPCAVVRAAGELDMAVAPRLRAEVDRVLDAPGRPCLVMDLTQVPFCDSVGLGVLVSALARVRDAQGRLILVVGPGMITHLLTITNLDRYFETRSSLREAYEAAA
ncbi:STAS domain-containing protein [Streptosporangium sp. NPDC048047]|uniref:STAS domain-containing protein n=1 Tax=unclassified Streptosporangium TaxID=2632669 RepID=UPI00342C1DCC